MHQNISLGSNGVDRVPSLQKLLTWLRGTNFCTSSARFAPSFVTRPNCPKCTQIVRNAPKHQFRVQWGGDRVPSLWKIPTRLRYTDFWTISASFALSFVRQPNYAKHPKSRKHTKTWVLSLMDWIGCVRYEKFRTDFRARTFAPVCPVLH